MPRFLSQNSSAVFLNLLKSPDRVALALPLVIIFFWFAYSPGINGSFFFDDYHNLEGLSEVRDFKTTFDFIISGSAGPLGRPIALATFAPQAYAWPQNPDAFLRVNVLIHLLNGLLVAWLVVLISRARAVDKHDAAWLAVLTAALWLSIPLLASSTLFIVQRMATLATTMLLAGTITYLYTRQRLLRYPRSTLFRLSITIILFTVAASLTKENGLLLPVLILVVETTLFPRSIFSVGFRERAWAWLFLVAPLIVIATKLISSVPYPELTELQRGFTAEQRLWTQATLLWQYLYNGFLPNPKYLTPFLDSVTLRESATELVVLVSVTAWLLTLFLAVYFRRTFPLFSFAVLWYLGAHLLESTLMPLELAFYHRNYLAFIGPSYSLVAAIWSFHGSSTNWIRVSLIVYILALSASLWNTTNLWGRPSLGVEIWALHNPNSLRAEQMLARQLQESRYHRAALRVLDRARLKEPSQRAVVGLQSLVLACALDPEHDHTQRVDDLLEALPAAGFYQGVPSVLAQLRTTVEESPCNGVTRKGVRAIADALLDNPRYAGSRVAAHDIHALLGQMAFADRNFNETIIHFELALRSFSTMEGLKRVVALITDAGRADLIEDFFLIVRSQPPRQPIRRILWKRELDKYEMEIRILLEARGRDVSP